jgi:hypothetical protein
MPDAGDLQTPKGIRYLEGYWRLAPDEALVLDFEPEPVPYWGFLIVNFLDGVARVARPARQPQQPPGDARAERESACASSSRVATRAIPTGSTRPGTARA